jgi:hypothetical protein
MYPNNNCVKKFKHEIVRVWGMPNLTIVTKSVCDDYKMNS